MGKTLAIINQKGGVGKTTTAVNLSAMIAELGFEVLLVDLDPQGNTTSGLGMQVEEKSIYEVLLGRISMQDCIEKTPWKGLSIAGADIRLAGAELELVGLEQREFRLRTALNAVKKDYDFVFIDCPPIEIVADSQIINRFVDNTLFVIRAELLERSMLPIIEKLYTDKKYCNLGLVLNGTYQAHSGKYGYSYRYGYNYGYGYGYDYNEK